MRPRSTRLPLAALGTALVMVASTLALTHVGAAGASASPSTATVTAQVGATEPAASFDADAPNVVLITTDDQTLQEMRWMPSTRRLLGRKGVTFDHMLSPHPLCCPARAELMTGQFAQNNGVRTNGGPYGGYGALRDPSDTLPVWLQSAGYETSMIGKFLNKWRPDEHGQPAGWSDFRTSPVDSFGYYDFSIWANGKTTSYDDGKSYTTTYVTEQVLNRVRRWSAPETEGLQAGQQRPFFIWASYYAPHGDCRSEGAGCKAPPTPERKYRDLYRDVPAPSVRKPSFTARLDDPNPMVAGRPKMDRAEATHYYRQRIRSLKSVDNGVRRIVRTLGRLDQLEDTLIIFTSDNGYLIGEHRYVGKVLAYREALEVPLLVRGPGVQRGATRRQYATTVDLATTIAAAAGVRPTRRTDGRDLRPLLRRNRPGGVDTVLVQAGEHPTRWRRGPWMFRGVNTKRYTYTRWNHEDGGRFEELFDHKRDPFELDNVASSRAYRAVRRELRQRTAALRDCSGPSECFRRFGSMPGPR